MKEIAPFLWFDTQAEEAMNFYVDTFNGAPYRKKESRIVDIFRYEKDMDAPGAEAMEGKVINGIFELAGQRFMALDGGPIFKFTEATSFYVECEDQKEVDYFWNKLSAVPEAEQCGWLKDKYGLSWQIIYSGGAQGKQMIKPVVMFVGEGCGRAEEAVKFWTSVFPQSNVDMILHYGKGQEPDQEGTLKYAAFSLFGLEFGALDSAHPHQLVNQPVHTHFNSDDIQPDQIHPILQSCGVSGDKRRQD